MYSRLSLSGSAVAVAAALYSVCAQASGLFPANTTYLSNDNPTAVVLADVNGDGHPDIVEIDQVGDVAVLLNNGDGTFQAPVVYYVTDGTAQALTVADVNGDGKLDIIVASGTSNDVSIFLGNGDGTFQALTTAGSGTQAPHYAVGNDPIYVAVADLNGDGHLDIVTSNYNDGTVSVLLGNGDGTFQAQTTFKVGNNPNTLALADVNGDGKPDIVVVNGLDNTLQVLLGNGDGTFSIQTAISLGPAQTSVENQSLALGDVNKDGFPDVIVTDTGDAESSVQVLLNDQHGNFGTPNTPSGGVAGVKYVVGFNPQYVTLADVNKDGNLDIIVGNITDNTLGVLFGAGDGTFGTQALYAVTDYGPFAPLQAIAVGDVNGDGFPDIVVRDPDDGGVQVLYNRGDGTFHPPGSIDVSSVGTAPAAIATADLNGDGHADIVEVNATNGTIGVLFGNGDGTFQPIQSYTTGNNPATSHPQALVVTDVNGDGKPDIVVANYGEGTVTVFINNGSGVFNTQHTYPAYAIPTNANLSALAVADVTGDGKPDIVVANAIVNKVSVLRGNGDGTFNAPVSYSSGNVIDDLAIGDMNNDGHPDIVVAGNFISVLLSDGAGGFEAPISCLACNVPGFHIALSDLNGDGNLDVIIVDNTNSSLDVLLGTGNFTATPATVNGAVVNTYSFLGSPADYPTGLNPSSIVLTDMNGDGNTDAVVTTTGDNSVSVMLGNGHGAFIGQGYPVEIDPRGAAAATFDEQAGKGYGYAEKDLAVVNGVSNTIDVLLQIPDILNTDIPPVATMTQSLLTVADGATAVTGQLLAGVGTAGDTLNFSTISADPNAAVTVTPDTGAYSYQANTGFEGNDSFTFQVSDGIYLSNIATVQVQVASNSTIPSSSHHKFLGAFGFLQLLMLLPVLLRRRWKLLGP